MMLLVFEFNTSCFLSVLSKLLLSLNIGTNSLIIITCGYFYTFLSAINCSFIVSNCDPNNNIISDINYSYLKSSLLLNYNPNSISLYLFVYLENFDSGFYSKVSAICDNLPSNIYFVFVCSSINRFCFFKIVSRCFPYFIRSYHNSLYVSSNLDLRVGSLLSNFSITLLRELISTTSPLNLGYTIYKLLLLNSLRKNNTSSAESRLLYFIQCNNIKFYSVSDITLVLKYFYMLKYGESIFI
ncbi:hypothetical protein [Candidatus Vidania fulgoroideorum]